jgi:two-component system sensor histidine kinase BaeS
LSVQKYFDSTQLDSLRRQAEYRAHALVYFYQRQGDSWGQGLLVRGMPNEPVLLAVVDGQGHPLVCSQPDFLANGNCGDPMLQQALNRALNERQTVDGYFQVSTNLGTVSSLYVSVPLQEGDKIIGAMFLSQPQIYPNAFPDQVNSAIVVTALIVASIVVLFSFLLVRRLTRPLILLTTAAEQVKQGKYTQRVATPRSEDEIGLLTLTFNEMADTIEADVNELRRQEQARRELLANIAHDLATPLTAIQGFSEALADDMIASKEGRQETAQRIAREVQRLRRMVGDLQQMTSLESGQTSLDLAPLNIFSLVEETLAVIAPECEQKGITLHNEIPPFSPLVLADSDRIAQVLLNLLDNARRHTPNDGTISAGAAPHEHCLYIWVSDTGVGIDAADLPHIFERFYRADRARTGTTGGSGLGLSIVKAIITAHGGTIYADSMPGRGTRIIFTLPLAE